jgi:hypothetical protein
MNRLWLLFFIFLLPIGAWAKIQWASQYRFILGKDEPAYILIHNANDDAIPVEEFKFSWTLFDTRQLVLHTRYRDFPKQHVLTLDRGKTSLREQLIPDANNRMDGNTQLLLEFVEFDNEEKLATIDAFIQDRNGRTRIEFDDPRRRQGK